jgi:hypothetical protein
MQLLHFIQSKLLYIIMYFTTSLQSSLSQMAPHRFLPPPDVIYEYMSLIKCI